MKILAIAVLGISLAVVGCKSSTAVKNPDGTTTNPNGSVTVPAAQTPQGSLNSDGSITNADGSVTYPANSPEATQEKQQAASALAPVTGSAPASAPAPVSASPPPAAMVVPRGTDVSVTLTQTLSASHNEVGDRFSGVLARPLAVNGVTVFRAGTPVSGEVVSSKGKGRFKGAGDLGISLTAIGRETVETNVYEKNSPGRGKRTTGFVAGGAGLGALIGGLAGGGKGALIGGLAGGGGGAATDAYTGSRDVVIPSESDITFRLTQPLHR